MNKPEDAVKIYNELCTSYRAIDDFRAKLLGLIPLVTGTGISLLFKKIKNAQDIQIKTKGLLREIGANREWTIYESTSKRRFSNQ